MINKVKMNALDHILTLVFLYQKVKRCLLSYFCYIIFLPQNLFSHQKYVTSENDNFMLQLNTISIIYKTKFIIKK